MADDDTKMSPLTRRGITLLTLAGIELRLDQSWFLIFVLILV